jgi:hypothetical protein
MLFKQVLALMSASTLYNMFSNYPLRESPNPRGVR